MKNTQKIVLSIIIPVFNKKQYLVECLESCLNQEGVTQNDYEIILIDDGSNDGSELVIKDYENNKNIICLYQDNAGPSVARNKGMALARGTYIWFIDADDFIPKYAIKLILLTIEKQNADIFWIGMYRFGDDQIKYNDRDIDKYEANIKLRSCYTVKSIRKKSFLSKNRITFDEENSYLSEDYLIHFRVMKCKPVEGVVTEKPLYFYRNISSSKKQLEPHKGLIDRINSWLYVLRVQKTYFDNEEKPEQIDTALEMQDCVKGIIYWLSLLENQTLNCFSKTFNRDYLPYIFSLRLRCIYINIRAFFYRRIVNSYNKKKCFFKRYILLCKK